MNRKDFISTLALGSLMGTSKSLASLENVLKDFPKTSKMPVLFLGHGSPMNAVEDNEFVRGFRQMGKALARPTAIVCVSAHWETKGTKVTAMEQPRTIHDFGGFPKALYDIEYPAPGQPELAKEIVGLYPSDIIEQDHEWGLDHGAWTVIRHMYPDADIPIVQLSLDYRKSAREHYDIARQLSSLRHKGVLLVGSGNVVHNLRMVAWDKMHVENYAFDWAVEASEKIKSFILKGDMNSLIDYQSMGRAFQLAIPTPEHYLPLLYALSLKEKDDKIKFFNDKALGGSLTMTSVFIG